MSTSLSWMYLDHSWTRPSKEICCLQTSPCLIPKIFLSRFSLDFSRFVWHEQDFGKMSKTLLEFECHRIAVTTHHSPYDRRNWRNSYKKSKSVLKKQLTCSCTKNRRRTVIWEYVTVCEISLSVTSFRFVSQFLKHTRFRDLISSPRQLWKNMQKKREVEQCVTVWYPGDVVFILPSHIKIHDTHLSFSVCEVSISPTFSSLSFITPKSYTFLPTWPSF